jgi:pimeloyl-ACP methyl ester carboxylesterase
MALAHEPSVGPATIRVERIQGPVLLISGRADRIWPSERLADIAFQRLQAHAFPHHYGPRSSDRPLGSHETLEKLAANPNRG